MADLKRIEYIDMLRVTACFLVLFTHSAMSNNPENGKWLGFISFASSPSSELFLTLSGAVLLPVHVSIRNFYKRRFMKLIPPMLVWSVFGVVLATLLGKNSWPEAAWTLAMIPLKPVVGIYWFLYVMVGLYLFAPFISYWLREASKKSIQLFLCIWVVNLCIPWLNLLIPGLYNQDGSYYWVFCYFGGFLGYWILGSYLRRFPPTFRSWFGFLIIFLAALYVGAIILLRSRVDDWTVYWDNLQVGSAILVTLLFMVIKRVAEMRFSKHYVNPFISFVAKYSFGIYLMHPFLIRDGLWHIFEHCRMYNHPVLETILIDISTIAICIGIMKLFTFLYKPLGKWMFGLN